MEKMFQIYRLDSDSYPSSGPMEQLYYQEILFPKDIISEIPLITSQAFVEETKPFNDPVKRDIQDLVCVINAGATHICDHWALAEAKKRLRYITSIEGPGKRSYSGVSETDQNNENSKNSENTAMIDKQGLKFVGIRPIVNGYDTNSLSSDYGYILEFVTTD
ncbi:unnamed protein product [Gordionus sp. m RMFG-2023]